MDATPPSSSAAIYHEISPTMLWARRIFSAITIFNVALAMLFCLIKGKEDGTFYLLFVNILISCVVILFLLWWYRTGDLATNYFWFIVLIASIIIFQCITTDVFVFNHEKTPATTPTTVIPITLVTPNATNATTKAMPLLKPTLQSPLPTMTENVAALRGG